MATVLHKETIQGEMTGIFSTLPLLAEKVSECGWFLLCLVLFLVLGPFSAPVVLLVLAKEGKEAMARPEPEAIVSR
jgi:hypothetical protein